MEVIGQVTGGVAHDFNNLLMAVLSSLELAKRRVRDDAKTLALIDNAIQGAQRGAQLTARMLAFARKQPLKLAPIDMAGLVHGMYSLLQRSIGPAITIETRFNSGLPQACGDAVQVESALMNLVVNARDAMPEGGTISIVASECTEADDSSRPQRWVCLMVQDTGEGMDEETLKRATEPFFTTKEVGKGTGLGLSMIQGLMEQSGGKLRLHSSPGQGTRVELLFPIHVASSVPAPQLAAEQPDNVVPARRALDVLVVDDDDLVIINVGAMLEDMGHRVRLCRNGQDALDQLERGKTPDLLITDHAMPRMSGLQLAARVRASWPKLPIILASGVPQTVVPHDEVDAVLNKPYSQSHLAQAMLKVLGPDERESAGRAKSRLLPSQASRPRG